MVRFCCAFLIGAIFSLASSCQAGENYTCGVHPHDVGAPLDPPVVVTVTLFACPIGDPLQEFQIAEKSLWLTGETYHQVVFWDIQTSPGYSWFFAVSDKDDGGYVTERVWDPNGPGTVTLEHPKAYSRLRPISDTGEVVHLRKWKVLD